MTDLKWMAAGTMAVLLLAAGCDNDKTSSEGLPNDDAGADTAPQTDDTGSAEASSDTSPSSDEQQGESKARPTATASQKGTSRAFLSAPAARPTGLGNVFPQTRCLSRSSSNWYRARTIGRATR